MLIELSMVELRYLAVREAHVRRVPIRDTNRSSTVMSVQSGKARDDGHWLTRLDDEVKESGTCDQPSSDL